MTIAVILNQFRVTLKVLQFLARCLDKIFCFCLPSYEGLTLETSASWYDEGLTLKTQSASCPEEGLLNVNRETSASWSDEGLTLEASIFITGGDT